MPATPSRIGFITADVRRVTAGPNAAVEAKYGKLARDTKEPIETFFDTTSDALAMATERLSLLSPDRRLVSFTVSGVDTGLALSFSGVMPTAKRISSEFSLDDTASIVKIDIDFESDTTTLTCWG